MILEPIPVTVLTGFLGSGKTTIIKRLLRDPDFTDTAIIVNEFGEVGLDHVLLEAADEVIVDLSCGCICCTIRGDLVSTLNDLYERRSSGELPFFRRVVVETTGLADPAPIIHTLMQEPLIFEHFRLARVVTAVDAVNGLKTLDLQPEAIKQVAVADALLVTKTDIANDTDTVAALPKVLKKINPSVETRNCVQGEIDPRFFFAGGLYDPGEKSFEVKNWFRQEATPRDHAHNADVNRHGAGIHTFTLSYTDPVSRGALGVFIQMLADQKGDDLLRLKGLVLLTDYPDRPAVIHGVQHVIHPIRRLDGWPVGIAETRIVLVVRNINKVWVQNLWDQVLDSSYADLIV